jgi:Glycosyltransferase family 87
MSKLAAFCRIQPRAHPLAADLTLAAISLVAGLWGCLWLGPLCVEAMRPDDNRLNDYYQDWGSARNYWVGQPIYTEHAQSIPRHLGSPPNLIKTIDYNAHPPASVLLALPFAQLSYADAVLAWNTVSLLAFLGSLVIVAKVLPVPTNLYLPILALLTFCHPLYGNLHSGQLTLILVLLVTAVWALERSGRSAAAGLVMGIATAIKLFPAYLAAYYIARGQFRPLRTAAFSFTTITVLTLLLLGLDTYRDYVCVVLPHQTKFRSFGYNLSIAGFWHKLFDPEGERRWMSPLWASPVLARWAIGISDLWVTFLVGTLAYRARTPAQRDLAFAIVIVAMLLVSPVTWDISLPLLLIPIAVIARNAKDSRLITFILMFIIIVIWTPQIILTKLALGGRSLNVAPWTFMVGAPSVKFYALLAVFGLGLVAFLNSSLNTNQEAVNRSLRG